MESVTMRSGVVSARGRIFAVLYRVLGRLFQRRENTAIALICLKEAVRLNPGDTESLSLIGRIHFANNKLEAAAEAFKEALRSAPNSAEIHNILGVTLEKMWMLEEAEEHYLAALNLKPAYASAQNNLGNIRRYSRRFDEAEACYRAALVADPDYVEAHSNLGIVLNELERFEEAEAACRTALRLRPGFAGAVNNLAVVLRNQGRLEEAEHAYREALSLDPNLLEAQVNLGVLRNDAVRLASAVTYLEQELKRNPRSTFANMFLGLALQTLGRYDEAHPYLETALELEPTNLDARTNLGNNLIFQADVESALTCYREVLAIRPHSGAYLSYLLYVHNAPGMSPAEIFEKHLDWAKHHADPLRDATVPHKNSPDLQRKLKIGYVSSDFCRHSVSYFIEPVIRRHDRSSFDVYCYSNVVEPDTVTERLKTIPDIHWREIRIKTHEEVAELIRDDGIDILVDLIGHTNGCRLQVFARKPAPVQVTYLGYPDTTGLSTIDYRITDAYADPIGLTDQYHTEKLVRMPRSFLTYLPLANAPDVAPPPFEKKGYITFGSFNNLPKMNRKVLELWAKILHAVPDSRLILKSITFKSARAKVRFVEILAELGIPEERVDLVAFIPDVASHLDLYREVDIGLDPFPYNGTTTTCEAMWMGVPVITLAGVTHVARVGVSLLTNVRLESLIARDEDEYLNLAKALAGDRARVRQLRYAMRDMIRSSPLADADGFTRELEAAYRSMWTRWCAAQTRVPQQ